MEMTIWKEEWGEVTSSSLLLEMHRYELFRWSTSMQSPQWINIININAMCHESQFTSKVYKCISKCSHKQKCYLMYFSAYTLHWFLLMNSIVCKIYAWLLIPFRALMRTLSVKHTVYYRCHKDLYQVIYPVGKFSFFISLLQYPVCFGLIINNVIYSDCCLFMVSVI